MPFNYPFGPHIDTYFRYFCYAIIYNLNIMYSSPSILQPSILRPPLIIRPLDLVLKGNFLC